MKIVNILVLFILLVSCQKAKKPEPYYLNAKECLETYKLDGHSQHFTDDQPFVVNVFIHELVPDSMRYPMAIYDSMIVNLNRIYSLSNISFYLTGVECCDPQEFIGTTSIVRYSTKHNKKKALNIYVIPDDSLDYRGGAVSVPGTACAIQRSWLATSTAAHEFGHMQGLKHIHEKDKTSGYNVIFGDAICDTPSPSEDLFSLPDCVRKLLGKTTEESQILLTNVMGYSYHLCRINLTPVQAARIRLTYELNDELRACIRI